MRNGSRQNHPVVSLPETSRHAIQRQIEQTGKGIEKKNESGRLRYLNAEAGEAGRKPRCVTWVVVVVFSPSLSLVRVSGRRKETDPGGRQKIKQKKTREKKK